jgi:peroxiredoxin
MLDTGAAAPGFERPGADGHEIGTYRLSEYTQSGPVVLLFYPFDFSPVCTAELCDFRDSQWLTLYPNVDVFGISTDSAYAHQAVINQNDLPFPLISDHDGSVSQSYDVLYEELEEHPRVSMRAVYVIDSDETIRYAWEAETYTDDPDVGVVGDAVRSIIDGSESSSVAA